jgi:hypothetical protein
VIHTSLLSHTSGDCPRTMRVIAANVAP